MLESLCPIQPPKVGALILYSTDGPEGLIEARWEDTAVGVNPRPSDFSGESGQNSRPPVGSELRSQFLFTSKYQEGLPLSNLKPPSELIPSDTSSIPVRSAKLLILHVTSENRGHFPRARNSKQDWNEILQIL